MGKTEIIAELSNLTAEDLADVRAWIDRIVPDKTGARTEKRAMVTAQIRTPRLANPAQAADFIKQVREMPANASI